MVNKSIDMRVYNESKQQSKNLLAHYPKTTVAFNLCFDLDWRTWMNSNKLKMVKYEKFYA